MSRSESPGRNPGENKPHSVSEVVCQKLSYLPCGIALDPGRTHPRMKAPLTGFHPEDIGPDHCPLVTSVTQPNEPAARTRLRSLGTPMSENSKLKLARVLFLSCAMSMGLAFSGCSGSQTDDSSSSAGGTGDAEYVDLNISDSSGSAGMSESTDSVENTSGTSNESTTETTEVAPAVGPTAEDLAAREREDRERRARESAELAEAEQKFLLQRAREAFTSGNVLGALEMARNIVARFPDNADARMLLSEATDMASAGATGTKANAEREMVATLQEYEREAEKLFRAANSYSNNGDWSKAVREYNRLLELIRFAPYKAELSEKYLARAEASKRHAEVNDQQRRFEEQAEQQREAARREQLLKIASEQLKNETVVKLWREALYNMDLKRFDTARQLIDRVLYLDANFTQAQELREQIDAGRLQNLRRETFERRMLGYRAALIQLQQASVPDNRRVVFATGSDANQVRERADKRIDSVRLPREQVAIRNALESKIVADFTYEEATIEEVIRRVREEVGVNIQIDKDEADPQDTVSLELHNVSLWQCLQTVMDLKSLKAVYANNVLNIVGKDSSYAEQVVTAVHDVRDITYRITEFKAPILNLRESAGRGNEIVFPSIEEPEPPVTDDVIEMIERGVSSDTWGSPPYVMMPFGGQLVVTHTPEVQAQVRDFLNELRRVSGLLVTMEARFITVNNDFLQDFGIDFRGLGGPASVPNQANLILEDVRSQEEDNAGGAFDNGSLGVPTANPSAGIFFNSDDPSGPVNFNRDIRGRFENIFDNALGNRLSTTGGLAMQVGIFRDITQINMVIQTVEKAGKGKTLVAPRLSAYNAQRANISMINQIPYIQDFEVQTAANSAIANPIIDTILDGVVLEVKPTISNDRRFITLEVQPTVADLVLPIPTFVTVLGPTSAVTIQIPELKIQSARATVRVPDGGAVVIGGLKTMRDIDRESTTPILGDIPLIGTLFKRRGRVREQSNLVIMIQAYVVDLNDLEQQQPGWSN